MPDLPLFDDDPGAGSRLSRVSGALLSWARTEVGGWVIIAVLGITILTAAAILLAVRYASDASQDQAANVQTLGGPTPEMTRQVEELTLTPDAIQDMTPDAARTWNAALPFSTAPNRPARPFIVPSEDLASYGRALDCLTAAVYYEAGFETDAGQAAVAQVVLNRVRHPAFPHTVCGVVFHGSERATGCQFTFTCDGALARPPVPAAWQRARVVASAALNGRVTAAVGTATHYHGDYVAPTWAPKLAKIVQIQTHIFYRWNGAWGFPAAFTGVYRGGEPIIEKMAHLSTALAEEEALADEQTDTVAPDIQIGSLPQFDDIPQAVPSVPASPSSQAENAAALEAPVDPVASRPQVRAAPVANDPLANPASAPTARDRNRRRTAAPSSW